MTDTMNQTPLEIIDLNLEVYPVVQTINTFAIGEIINTSSVSDI